MNVVLGFVLSLSLSLSWHHVDAVVPAAESYPNRYRGNSEKHIVIIGAGPTGLGAAWRLHELGYTNWTLIEATQLTGGLAKSQTDANGFTWDHGVHVLFSHYHYFDSLLDYVLPESEWFHHTRYSPAYMRGRFVDYPVQNNCWQLPKNDTLTCLSGLSSAARSRGSHGPPKNFDDWVVQGFGEGLANLFMRPYNFKVWAHPTHELNVQWVGERVATIDLDVIMKHMIYELPDRQWGPNARFRYPARGSGQIWASLFSLLPSSHVSLDKRVVGLELSDPSNKRLVFQDKTALHFDALLSTLPIDKLTAMCVDQPQLQELSSLGFKHQTVNLVGIGIEGPVPQHINATYWVYFPEEVYVFYRLTVLSNFSPYMVPKPGKQYSILVEVSESKYRKVDHENLIDQVIQGLILSNFMTSSSVVVDRWQERFEYGYPVPYVGRDKHVHTADEQLRQHNIWSRGRFGSWKYEVANQDHSLMLGVEAIDNILFGTEEVTYRKPDVVNAGKGEGRTINPPTKRNDNNQNIKQESVEPLDVSSAPRFYTIEDSHVEKVRSRVVSLSVPEHEQQQQQQESTWEQQPHGDVDDDDLSHPYSHSHEQNSDSSSDSNSNSNSASDSNPHVWSPSDGRVPVSVSRGVSPASVNTYTITGTSVSGFELIYHVLSITSMLGMVYIMTRKVRRASNKQQQHSQHANSNINNNHTL